VRFGQPGDGAMNVRSRIGALGRGLVGRQGHRPGTARGRHGQIVGNAVDEAHQQLCPAQRGQFLPGAAERLLGQLLGVVAPPGQAVDVADERGAVTRHELGERTDVALSGPVRDLSVRQVHGESSWTPSRRTAPRFRSRAV
jgi:hypothetical protein